MPDSTAASPGTLAALRQVWADTPHDNPLVDQTLARTYVLDTRDTPYSAAFTAAIFWIAFLVLTGDKGTLAWAALVHGMQLHMYFHLHREQPQNYTVEQAFETRRGLETRMLFPGVVWALAPWVFFPGVSLPLILLIPLTLQLLAVAGLELAALDAIAFGRGPGSFTGLRTACSVAQGLAFGSGVRLLPVDTLLAVAEEARHAFGARQVVAVLDARMDQLYAARYDFEGGGELGALQGNDNEPLLLAPEALEVPAGWSLAGNAFAAYGPRLAPAAARHEVLPTAAAMLRLAPALLAAGRTVDAAHAWPLYVRDKVAQTTEERAAIKAAAVAISPV